MLITLVKQKKWILITLVVIVLLGGAFVFMHNHSIHKRQAAVHIPTTSSSQSDKPGQKSTSKTSNSSPQSAPTSDKSTVQTGESSLITPSGTFVSNHRPSLSGSDLLKQEKSVCNSTPGATCYILFMKDGVAKQLDPQVIDNTGSTYWTWDVNQAGFTPGSWKITAVASLNGQTLSRDDGLALEVQP